ncbi:hypothetical protein N474_01865 [Pseudoalteromonas luteoviolacea CPMOR-2]|uniref:Yip1 family protein n=1 Tax=Pseudoalteromonas luteoviolacea TaxID=43657 RepID=UPI0007B06E20|nr:Yip1 family protein [Pseudoalteromonas luteoviolacea]KZN54490.1 hypothetical protein N474_01865 [Pseudoalteromonas luteoviolacea CPMOR-2]
MDQKSSQLESLEPETSNLFPRLNPWLSIWTQPRATIQQIIDSGCAKYILLLVMISGVNSTLDRAVSKSMGDDKEVLVIVAMSIATGALSGVFFWALGSAATRLIGKWLGGVGTYEELRTAIAWSNVPSVLSLMLWVPLIAIAPNEIFATNTPTINANTIKSVLYWGIMTIQLVLGIWSLILMIKCVAQVQEFSFWRAFSNLLLAGVALVVPVGIAIAIAIGLGK